MIACACGHSRADHVWSYLFGLFYWVGTCGRCDCKTFH